MIETFLIVMLFFTIIFGISNLWGGGINKMNNEHPDYKGEDLFNEDETKMIK